MSKFFIDEKNRSAEHWGIKTQQVLKDNWIDLEKESRPAKSLKRYSS